MGNILIVRLAHRFFYWPRIIMMLVDQQVRISEACFYNRKTLAHAAKVQSFSSSPK
jgi:hypothetical protein